MMQLKIINADPEEEINIKEINFGSPAYDRGPEGKWSGRADNDCLKSMCFEILDPKKIIFVLAEIC